MFRRFCVPVKRLHGILPSRRLFCEIYEFPEVLLHPELLDPQPPRFPYFQTLDIYNDSKGLSPVVPDEKTTEFFQQPPKVARQQASFRRVAFYRLEVGR